MFIYEHIIHMQFGTTFKNITVDFNQKQIVVRDTKGGNNRITMLPISLIEDLKLHLQYVKRLHQHDLDHGYGAVHLPFALARKYAGADRQWIWQFVWEHVIL